MDAVCLAAKPWYENANVLWVLGGSAAVVIIGIIAFAMIDRWRKRQLDETFTPHDQLASFRVLYERGELSREEFDRIRKQLLVRMKRMTLGEKLPPVDPPPKYDDLAVVEDDQEPPPPTAPHDPPRSDGSD